MFERFTTSCLRLSVQRCILIFCAGLFGLALISTAHAATPIRPFTATYVNDESFGLNFSGSVKRVLSFDAKKRRWMMSSNADSWFAQLDESTQFRMPSADTVEPLHYSYQRRVLLKKHAIVLNFNWLKKVITTHVNGDPWQMKIKPQTQDRLSYQLQLRLDLMAGKTKMSYPVADGGLVKTYNFEVVGNERIQTDAGTFDTVKVRRVHSDEQRATHIWFAPKDDFMIIKLDQTRPNGKAYGLILQKVSYTDVKQ